MKCFFNDSPELSLGLEQHGFMLDNGVCIRNNGASTTPFGERWSDNPRLISAVESGKSYYFDRIIGGFQYQSLEGIDTIVQKLENDANFLGFQAHEWAHSPLADHRRVDEFLIERGLEFNHANFSQYEGRVDYPFFSGGDFHIYKDLYRSLTSASDARGYLRDYFSKIVRMTGGNLVAVNGYSQGYHMALQLGAKNIMAEIGNQVKLTALQLMFTRGAAREYEKEFGFYYEPWGSSPVSAPCAVGFSTFYDDCGDVDKRFMGHNIALGFGSSRKLHERLLYFAWLSGASYCAEEWGAENYFHNWTDFPLTEYGRVMKDFVELTDSMATPEPIVSGAVVFPSRYLPVDISGVVAEHVHKFFKADEEIYPKLRRFSEELLSANRKDGDHESNNLTSSPWLGSFDFFTEHVTDDKLKSYEFVVYLDEEHFRNSTLPCSRKYYYTGKRGETNVYANEIGKALPYEVEGDVGSIQATCSDSRIVGLFNNYGAILNGQLTAIDQSQVRRCVVKGVTGNFNFLKGDKSYISKDKHSISLEIPAGELVLIQFPS